jgi:hypothetical protein
MIWNVPTKSTSISVSSVLPAGVTVAASGNAFQVNVAAVTITRNLGTDCAACSAANGATIPKPAFTSTGSSTATLPSGVTSATLTGDTLTVTIQNGFNFDPIKPGAGSNGFLVITATSGTAQIGKDSINGATSAIPAGATTTRKIPLSGTVTGAGGIAVAMTINSPLGDPVTINTAQNIVITARAGAATAGTVLISAASVTLANQSVSSTATQLDLKDVSSSVVNRVTSGTLFLTITNPFAVTGNLSLAISGGPATITKAVTLATGTSTASVAFTAAELRSILGFTTNLTLSGTVNGTTTVTPAQTLAVATRLQLAVSTEENK